MHDGRCYPQSCFSMSCLEQSADQILYRVCWRNEYVAGCLLIQNMLCPSGKSLSLPSHPARLVPEVIAREVKSRRATMSKAGILPVPAGEAPEFEGFSELQVRILVVYIVTSVLATVGLILRFYTGACLNQRRLGPDACTSAFSSQLYHNTPSMCRTHRLSSPRAS